MANIYGKFPALKHKLLLDWFFAQKQDPPVMENIRNFLTIMSINRDNALLKEILSDPRLPALPVSILSDLEQELLRYHIPRSFYASFPRLQEFNRYFAAGSTYQLSKEAVPELIRFLRQANRYVPARNVQ